MPKPRQRSITAEIQSIRRSLTSVVRSLGRLGSAFGSAARAQRGEDPRRRKLRLTPQRMAALKLQGKYIGHMRMLPARQQARVKALRVKKGVLAAIRYAQSLSKRQSPGRTVLKRASVVAGVITACLKSFVMK